MHRMFDQVVICLHEHGDRNCVKRAPAPAPIMRATVPHNRDRLRGLGVSLRGFSLNEEHFVLSSEREHDKM